MKWEDFYQPIDITKNKSLQDFIAQKKLKDNAQPKPLIRYTVPPNQEYANISGLNLYRVEFNDQWTNVWAFDKQSAKKYVIDNFCYFTKYVVFYNVKLLVQPQPTNEKEID